MAISDVNPYETPPKGGNMFAQITDNVARIAETLRPQLPGRGGRNAHRRFLFLRSR